MNKSLSKAIANNIKSNVTKNENQILLDFKHGRIKFLQRKQEKIKKEEIRHLIQLVVTGVVLLLLCTVIGLLTINVENNRGVFDYLGIATFPFLLAMFQYEFNRIDALSESKETIEKEVYELCLELFTQNDITDAEIELLNKYTDKADSAS